MSRTLRGANEHENQRVRPCTYAQKATSTDGHTWSAVQGLMSCTLLAVKQMVFWSAVPEMKPFTWSVQHGPECGSTVKAPVVSKPCAKPKRKQCTYRMQPRTESHCRCSRWLSHCTA